MHRRLDTPSPPERGPDRVSDGLFRQAMAAVATPVSVVATLEAGRPHGTTVSAFASLSRNPPMVLIALDENSGLLAVLHRTRRFALNVLSAGQDGLAGDFARKGPGGFGAVDWHEEDGLPRLGGAGVWLACTVDRLLPGGDHTIATGLVTGAHLGEDTAPLTYHRHRFGTHAVSGAPRGADSPLAPRP